MDTGNEQRILTGLEIPEMKDMEFYYWKEIYRANLGYGFSCSPVLILWTIRTSGDLLVASALDNLKSSIVSLLWLLSRVFFFSILGSRLAKE